MKEWERTDQGTLFHAAYGRERERSVSYAFSKLQPSFYTSLSPLVKYTVAAALTYLCEMPTVMATKPDLVDALLTRTKRKRGMAFWQCYG